MIVEQEYLSHKNTNQKLKFHKDGMTHGAIQGPVFRNRNTLTISPRSFFRRKKKKKVLPTVKCIVQYVNPPSKAWNIEPL